MLWILIGILIIAVADLWINQATLRLRVHSLEEWRDHQSEINFDIYEQLRTDMPKLDDNDRKQLEIIDDALETKLEDAENLADYAKLMHTCAWTLRTWLREGKSED